MLCVAVLVSGTTYLATPGGGPLKGSGCPGALAGGGGGGGASALAVVAFGGGNGISAAVFGGGPGGGAGGPASSVKGCTFGTGSGRNTDSAPCFTRLSAPRSTGTEPARMDFDGGTEVVGAFGGDAVRGLLSA